MTSFELRKDIFADERDDNLNEVGKPHQRQDMVGHVTGRSPYFDDHLFDGLLHLKCTRSPHHHARIRSVDTRAAEAHPDVVRVIIGADVPVNLNTLLSLLNFGKDDEQLLATRNGADSGSGGNANVWSMTSPAENADVYRAEFLAHQVLLATIADGTAETRLAATNIESGEGDEDALLAHVQQFMATRHNENYTKGIHDHDAEVNHTESYFSDD